MSEPACPTCGQPREARQLYCQKCRRPFGGLADAPALHPAPVAAIRLILPRLWPLLFVIAWFLLVAFLIIKNRDLQSAPPAFFVLAMPILVFLLLFRKSRWPARLAGDLRAGSQRVTVRLLDQKTRVRRKQRGGHSVRTDYYFEWVGKLRAVKPHLDSLEKGAEYEIIFLPGLGLAWEVRKVLPAAWVNAGRSSAGRAAGASAKLWVDGGPPRHNPAPADIAAALDGFTATLRLDTESNIGRLDLSRLAGSLLRLTHYGGISIRTAAPLTPEQADRTLQLAASDAPDWDREVAWDAAERPTLRDQALVLLHKSLLLALLFAPIGLIAGIIVGAGGVRHRLYDNPRCQAYAAAHGLTFIEYHSKGFSAGSCLMAEEAVSVVSINAVAPPPRWGRMVFEQHLYEFVIIPAILIALIILLVKLLVLAAKRREARRAARRNLKV